MALHLQQRFFFWRVFRLAFLTSSSMVFFRVGLEGGIVVILVLFASLPSLRPCLRVVSGAVALPFFRPTFGGGRDRTDWLMSACRGFAAIFHSSGDRPVAACVPSPRAFRPGTTPCVWKNGGKTGGKPGPLGGDRERPESPILGKKRRLASNRGRPSCRKEGRSADGEKSR